MDQEILKVIFMMCGVQWLCISPLGAQFTVVNIIVVT
jgi:hypothetical protein